MPELLTSKIDVADQQFRKWLHERSPHTHGDFAAFHAGFAAASAGMRAHETKAVRPSGFYRIERLVIDCDVSVAIEPGSDPADPKDWLVLRDKDPNGPTCLTPEDAGRLRDWLNRALRAEAPDRVGGNVSPENAQAAWWHVKRITEEHPQMPAINVYKEVIRRYASAGETSSDALDAARYRFIRRSEAELPSEEEAAYAALWAELSLKGSDGKRMDALIDAAMRDLKASATPSLASSIADAKRMIDGWPLDVRIALGLADAP